MFLPIPIQYWINYLFQNAKPWPGENKRTLLRKSSSRDREGRQMSCRRLICTKSPISFTLTTLSYFPSASTIRTEHKKSYLTGGEPPTRGKRVSSKPSTYELTNLLQSTNLGCVGHSPKSNHVGCSTGIPNPKPIKSEPIPTPRRAGKA